MRDTRLKSRISDPVARISYPASRIAYPVSRISHLVSRYADTTAALSYSLQPGLEKSKMAV